MDARLVGRVIATVRTVNPLLSVSAAALDLHQLPTSGTVRAQVAARLADGSFRVLIDGKALKLALPKDIKPGDVLELRVVGRETATAAASSAAHMAGKGVSSAGQLVADLVRLPAAAPTRQSQPALDSPPLQQVQTLAEPLARAVARSGLFYESHQARWVGGDYPLERLLQEPQARAANTASTKLATPALPVDEMPAKPEALTAPQAPVATDAEAEQTETKPAMAQEVRDAGAKAQERTTDIVARDALHIVRQQLDTLETRHIQWLGEIWPGQTMRWEIGEEAGHEHDARDAEHAWDSRFMLDLPALGSVGAALVLSGNKLRVCVSARDEATVAMMRESGDELVRALAASGIETSALRVEQREPDL